MRPIRWGGGTNGRDPDFLRDLNYTYSEIKSVPKLKAIVLVALEQSVLTPS